MRRGDSGWLCARLCLVHTALEPVVDPDGCDHATAMRTGVSLLRHRITGVGRSSTLTTRELDAAVPKRLLGQSLEEVLIQELEVEHRGRALAWRAVRSIIITEPIDRRS